MTDLVPIRRGKPTQVSLAELQDRLDARKQIAETRSGTSTRKGRVEEAKRVFEVDPLATLVEIQTGAKALADAFDGSISSDTIPLSQEQVNKLSREFLQLERIVDQIKALEPRYRSLIFAHLDSTLKKVPGRPLAQTPGRVAAEGPEPHYIFERRGGNREDPDLDTETLRGVLPDEIVAQIYLTVHHEAVPAWDEEVFDQEAFGKLVDDGKIDLDVVADHLTPGKWRTPTFNKTLVDGEQ